MREGSGLLGSRRGNFFSRCRAGFISFPGQISRLPAQYKIGGQPSKITKLQVLLGKCFHLQARPNDSHGRSAKYAGDIYKPGFGGHLFFSLSRYWFFGISSRSQFWPAFSMAGACGSTTLVVRCVICDTSSSTVGAGLRLLSVGSPTIAQSSPSPRSMGSDGGISYENSEFNCQHTQYFKTITRLLYSRSLPLET
jgi:hypothetical protein